MKLSPSPSSSSSVPSGAVKYKWFVLFGLWFLYLNFGLILASLAPLIPVIQGELGISYTAMGVLLGIWQFVYVLWSIPSGILVDKIGGRKALAIGGFFLFLSACGRMAAEHYATFLLGVMMLGIGGPIISSGSPKIIAQLFPAERRGVAMGISVTGPALGISVCLMSTHSIFLPLFDDNWRAVMAVWAGSALSATVVWYVITRLVKLDYDMGMEATSPTPAVPQRQVISELLAQPAVRIILAMSIGLFLINHSLNNWLPEMLIALHHMPPTVAGYWSSVPVLVGIIGALFIPRIATPKRRIYVIGTLCVFAAITPFMVMFTSPFVFVPGLILQGFMRMSLMTLLVLVLVELPAIDTRRAGTASGLFFSAAEFGGMFGPLSVGLIYDILGGFRGAFFMLSLIGLLLIYGTNRLRLAK